MDIFIWLLIAAAIASTVYFALARQDSKGALRSFAVAVVLAIIFLLVGCADAAAPAPLSDIQVLVNADTLSYTADNPETVANYAEGVAYAVADTLDSGFNVTVVADGMVVRTVSAPGLLHPEYNTVTTSLLNFGLTEVVGCQNLPEHGDILMMHAERCDTNYCVDNGQVNKGCICVTCPSGIGGRYCDFQSTG